MRPLLHALSTLSLFVVIASGAAAHDDFESLSSNYLVNLRPRSFAIGDLNGDCWLDCVTLGAQFQLSISLGQPGGGVGPFTLVPAESSAWYADHVTLADIDGDGFLDVAYTDSRDQTVVVHAGDGRGGP